jgi:hypothetical protein
MSSSSTADESVHRSAVWRCGSSGGAVARVPDDATAFNGRSAGFTFNMNGKTASADGLEEQRQWARDYWAALAPFHTGVYVNFLMEEGTPASDRPTVTPSSDD